MRNGISNMEVSRHDDIVTERFSIYKQGENRSKAVSRLRIEGIDLRKSFLIYFMIACFKLIQNPIIKLYKSIF